MTDLLWIDSIQDIDPWYTYVEKFVGVSGNKDGLEILPDGDFLRPFGTNCVEDYFSDQMKKYYKNRHVIYGRCAHLTESKPIYVKQGRVFVPVAIFVSGAVLWRLF